MQENRQKTLKAILTYEGGKDDDPRDPGGRTNQGITQRVYSAWRKSKGLPVRDVFLMEAGERDAIYYGNYFAKVHFDELPPGLDFVLVDGAVNSGPSQSIKWLQRALNLRADGVLGDVTMERLNEYSDHDKLIADILQRRRLFLRALKHYPTFRRGWEARVNNVEKVGQAMARGSVGPNVVFIPNGNKKALAAEAKPLPSTAPADITASGGVVSGALSTAQSVLDPLQGRSEIIDQVLLALLVIGALATAFGVAYGLYVRNKRKEIADALDIQEHYGAADNDNVPEEVLSQYVDPNDRSVATGNIAPGVVTQSGRVSGDNERRIAS